MSNYNHTTSSVTLMLHDLNWNTLCDRRKEARLYKILHNLDVLLPGYITLATRFTREHDLKLILPQLMHISLVFSLTRLLYSTL